MERPEKRPMEYDRKQKGSNDAPSQAGGVWPPAPTRMEPPSTEASTPNYLLTGINWLDAALGIPCGFIIGFILWAIAGFIVKEIVPPPSHRPQVLAIWAIGAVLTATAYGTIARRYSLIAVTMWIGGLPFYLLMLFLAWCDI